MKIHTITKDQLDQDNNYIGEVNLDNFDGNLECEEGLGIVKFNSLNIRGYIYFRKGSGIEAKGDIRSHWDITAYGDIKAGRDITARGAIIALEDIKAGGDIFAGWYITVGGDITARGTGNITSRGNITAFGDIKADGSIECNGRIESNGASMHYSGLHD